MLKTRGQRAKLNVLTSLISQFVTVICGIIVPRLLIGAFGSEIYGATASITAFLAYIALVEGGIGGVARAALYKPLSQKNREEVSAVVGCTSSFFRKLAFVFAAYVLFIACTYRYIANDNNFEWSFTFVLVIIIGCSTFAQYYFGMAYSILIQADQRGYITNTLSILTIILNTIFTVILVHFGCSITIIKLVSSTVYILRPIVLQVYVKKKYELIANCGFDKNTLSQKWAGFGQHIAYFFQNHTAVVVLTLFTNLSEVAVYSVYYMVVSSIRSLVNAFSGGMEAVFGDMLAKNEIKTLQKTFEKYELLFSCVTIILFSTTALLIVPFISLYTKNIGDVNYIRSNFAVLLIAGEAIYCLRAPSHNLTIAANHFKQTQIAAYIEAGLNIVLSCLFVFAWGLVGVAVGTVIAYVFRYIYYIFYVSNKILNRRVFCFIRRIAVNVLILLIIFVIALPVTTKIHIANYTNWALLGVGATLFTSIICIVTNFIFYREETLGIISMIKRKPN